MTILRLLDVARRSSPSSLASRSFNCVFENSPSAAKSKELLLLGGEVDLHRGHVARRERARAGLDSTSCTVTRTCCIRLATGALSPCRLPQTQPVVVQDAFLG